MPEAVLDIPEDEYRDIRIINPYLPREYVDVNFYEKGTIRFVNSVMLDRRCKMQLRQENVYYLSLFHSILPSGVYMRLTTSPVTYRITAITVVTSAVGAL